jgi:hypothetical protein
VGNSYFATKFAVNEIQKKISRPSGAIQAVSLYYVTLRAPDTFLYEIPAGYGNGFCCDSQASCLCDMACQVP